MIPGVFSGATNLANFSNTGVPGFYAYRVDTAVVIQPRGIKLLYSPDYYYIIMLRLY